MGGEEPGEPPVPKFEGESGPGGVPGGNCGRGGIVWDLQGGGEGFWAVPLPPVLFLVAFWKDFRWILGGFAWIWGFPHAVAALVGFWVDSGWILCRYWVDLG